MPESTLLDRLQYLTTFQIIVLHVIHQASEVSVERIRELIGTNMVINPTMRNLQLRGLIVECTHKDTPATYMLARGLTSLFREFKPAAYA